MASIFLMNSAVLLPWRSLFFDGPGSSASAIDSVSASPATSSSCRVVYSVHFNSNGRITINSAINVTLFDTLALLFNDFFLGGAGVVSADDCCFSFRGISCPCRMFGGVAGEAGWLLWYGHIRLYIWTPVVNAYLYVPQVTFVLLSHCGNFVLFLHLPLEFESPLPP